MNTTGTATKRWWRFAVLRGEGIPPHLDGKWYDLGAMDERLPGQWGGTTFEATNQWEQRADGEVAVVYNARPAGRPPRLPRVQHGEQVSGIGCGLCTRDDWCWR